MRRFFIYLLLLVVGILGALYLFLPVKTVEFSQQEIDQIVASELPHTIETLAGTITIRTATLELRKGDQLKIQTSFDVRGLTLEGEGYANFASGIRYKNGNFYLSDLTKEDIQFEFSQNSAETISDIRSTIEGIIEREEEEAKSGDVETAQNVRRVNEYITTQLQNDAEEALDRFLKSIPVYSLNNQGGTLKLAALALEDVSISESKVTATLSFQRLLVRVIVATLSALLFGLIIFGNLGIAVLSLVSKRNE